ncbi:biosynthetic-type acetolactate synthase large subunit [Enterococcus gallinarum]|uniref:biosynthetic-type acetolactate synthase large subunit n=1 Tax=Enterococcus gallinarum TaxID=1353 RepID=UPI001AD76332|nr:biosynthetic-type acetolactate synthase large subunit [Enterococcus gallinarum]MBO6416998.1 biosynthetic-type acetolactate synthase large subunit [Enterococcus gallinarum]MBO6421127.1 biosynthetic-type acetolactate synthase large subunit [Enterococcus gallinarum]MCR1928873.1 biosynthetic-type acetolactate synthase large subunit [Enterococcus gallinarum]
MENIQLNEVTRTGAEVLVDSLQKQAVELIFGYPGGAVLPLYDQLYDAAIPNILARHEQGAVHAAEGYAKATGKAGVVLVTSGPGATNVVTGIADAMSDSVPLVVITGQVATAGIGKDAFQEADILGITLPITKHNYQVRHVDDLPRVIAEAFHIATTGRKGPVVIDLPKDVTLQRTAAVIELPIERKSYQPTLFPSILQIEKLMNCLKQAKRPVVLAGAGVCAASAAEELRLFVETHHLPIVTTLLGLGLVPADHPLFLGMGGMHGTYAANMALSEADLIINIGSRFDDRLATAGSQFGQQAIIAHIDIDPAEIGKVVQTTIPIVADAKAALTQLLRYPAEELDCKEWLNRCQKRKKEHPYRYDREETKEIKPQKLIEEVGRLTKGEAVIVTDVGQHQMWVAQYYPFRFPKQLITSGGLGTMGYGIPAGIGAKFACPEKTIVVFVGDGGFQMTNQEFALLNDYGLDVKFILMNNRSLGMVRQWQETFHNERRSASVFAKQPNFGQLAEAYGINSVRIETPDQLTNDLANALLEPGARLIEVLISPTEHVLPMIPPGKANHEMIGV